MTKGPIFKGNHHHGYLGHGAWGTGAENVTVQLGWGSIAGHSGDVAYIQLSSMLQGDINQGIFFQSECPVTIDYTLCNPALASDYDPEVQASVLWSDTQTIPVNDITKSTAALFTVLRVMFGGEGTLYIGVR